MADDHTSQVIGAHGGRLAKLNPPPPLDKLAAEGMFFENCFVMNPICTPGLRDHEAAPMTAMAW